MTEAITYRGSLVGHRDWVTSIATCHEQSDVLVSSARDKKCLVWQLNHEAEGPPGHSRMALCGHSGAVQEVTLSSNAGYALSASWDSTLRLWDLDDGTTLRVFEGHKEGVHSVGLSADNRIILSGGRDGEIKLWNVLAECKHTIVKSAHTDCVTKVAFLPLAETPTFVSGSWDLLVKVWDLRCATASADLGADLVGHTAAISTVAVSPDGWLCASGDMDGRAMLWDMSDGEHLYTIDAGSPIHALAFSPQSDRLVAATGTSIKIWELDNQYLLDHLSAISPPENGLPWCVSLAWSADGNMLFAGATDGHIYVYEIQRS
eukprot:NODE_1152_length_1230_cov_263.899574.p1 GENE.NODE_1152_length_1230_cov_263.899574~~NODE_1152_length_1230_cov_263.899574.p1  ORF type:complete len:349 (+),score=81.21 NODE_1152_length_1230_cov_263.899574:95-1048(+)